MFDKQNKYHPLVGLHEDVFVSEKTKSLLPVGHCSIALHQLMLELLIEADGMNTQKITKEGDFKATCILFHEANRVENLCPTENIVEPRGAVSNCLASSNQAHRIENTSSIWHTFVTNQVYIIQSIRTDVLCSNQQ